MIFCVDRFHHATFTTFDDVYVDNLLSSESYIIVIQDYMPLWLLCLNNFIIGIIPINISVVGGPLNIGIIPINIPFPFTKDSNYFNVGHIAPQNVIFFDFIIIVSVFWRVP